MVDLSLISKLRSQTGCGLSDCKKALDETDNNLEGAIDWLRIKGISNAQKKVLRSALEGVIGIVNDDTGGLMIEVNCETDFVSRNDDFKFFVRTILTDSFSNDSVNSIDDLQKVNFCDQSYDDYINSMISKSGENIVIKRIKRMSGENVFFYIHSVLESSDNISMGKIGVLIKFDSAASRDVLSNLGKDIAMHCSFAQPMFLNLNDVDSSLIEKEKSVLTQQLLESGTPEDKIERIIEGKMNKYVNGICLNEQPFIKDNKFTVSEILKNKSKELGEEVNISEFSIFILGA